MPSQDNPEPRGDPLILNLSLTSSIAGVLIVMLVYGVQNPNNPNELVVMMMAAALGVLYTALILLLASHLIAPKVKRFSEPVAKRWRKTRENTEQ